MLGIGGTKPVAGRAEEVIACPTSKAYEIIGERFFEIIRNGVHRSWSSSGSPLRLLASGPRDGR